MNVQGSKPWRFTGVEENMEREDIKTLVDKWWEIYNDESLDLKSNERNADGKRRYEAEQGTPQPLRGETPKRVRILPAPPAA